MKKKQYIIPEIGINEYNFSLMKADTSPVLPPGGGGAPERRSGKEPAF